MCIRINLNGFLVIGLPCPVAADYAAVLQAGLTAKVAEVAGVGYEGAQLSGMQPEIISVLSTSDQVKAIEAVREFAAIHWPECEVVEANPGDAVQIADEIGWPIVFLTGECSACPRRGECWDGA